MPAARAMCLPRQAGVLKTVHSNALATVYLFGIDIDELSCLPQVAENARGEERPGSISARGWRACTRSQAQQPRGATTAVWGGAVAREGQAQQPKAVPEVDPDAAGER